MKKHIDKVFREKLQNHEVRPTPQAWKQLEAKLNGKKQQKKVLFPYWRAAAAVVIGIAVGTWVAKNQSVTPTPQTLTSATQQPLNQNTKPLPTNATQDSPKPEKHTSQPQVLLAKTTKNKAKAVKKTQQVLVQTNTSQALVINEEIQANTNQPIPEPQVIITANTNELPANTPENTEQTANYEVEVVIKTDVTANNQAKPKTWLKRTLQKLRNNPDENTETVQASVSIFGISTDKLFKKTNQQP